LERIGGVLIVASTAAGEQRAWGFGTIRRWRDDGFQGGVRPVHRSDFDDFARQHERCQNHTRIGPRESITAIDPLLDFYFRPHGGTDFVYDGKTPKQL